MRRSLSGVIVSCVLLAVALPSFAQVSLEFDRPTKCKTWVASTAVGPAPESAQINDGQKVSVALGSYAPTDFLYVLDTATGNLMKQPLDKELKALSIKPDSFTLIHETQIKVSHGGNPVAAANVEIAAASFKKSLLMTPSDKGVLTVYGLPFGSVKIQVRSKKDGKAVEIPLQVFELARERKDSKPTLNIAIGPEVDVVATAQPANTASGTGEKGTEKQASKPEAGPSGPGRLITILLGLLGAVAAGYFLLRFLQGNSKQVNEQLAKIGVQIPTDEPATDGDVPPPPAPSAPKPQAQILLDNAAPAPVASAPAPIPTRNAGFNAQPMLLRRGGGSFAIMEGQSAISREPGNVFGLEGEMTISRDHGKIVRTGSEVWLEDHESTNGSFVNGQKVVGRQQLFPGDEVQLGSVSFVVEDSP